jgi:hypothetical protein
VPVVWLAAGPSSSIPSATGTVALLLASIMFNYFVGHLLIAAKPAPCWRFAALTVGVSSDLLVLGIFKHAGFFAANLNAIRDALCRQHLAAGRHLLPPSRVASWTPIAQRRALCAPHYALFVTYFRT